MLRPLLISFLLLTACSAFDSGVESINQHSLLKQIEARADILILDVRTPGEFKEGHIPGAYHIDHREIASRVQEIEGYRHKPVVVYCYSGMRAGMVESYLIEHGFTQVKHLEGDWSAWTESELPTES